MMKVVSQKNLVNQTNKWSLSLDFHHLQTTLLITNNRLKIIESLSIRFDFQSLTQFRLPIKTILRLSIFLTQNNLSTPCSRYQKAKNLATIILNSMMKTHSSKKKFSQLLLFNQIKFLREELEEKNYNAIAITSCLLLIMEIKIILLA